MNKQNGTAPVTAVILSYRSREATARAVSSLADAHACGLLHCIVVDNASGDGTVEHIRASFPWVELIAGSENVGFGRGCNMGLERVRTPYVLLLNPDAELPLADLRILLSFLERTPLAGMAAPAIRTADGRLQHAGGAPTPWQVLAQACRPGWLPRDRTSIQPGAAPFRTDWLCGAVLLLRVAMLADIGTFDPRFFLYFEETDLCRRAIQNGWQLWAVGRAVAQHHCGVSARATGYPLVHGCIAEHYFRSRFQFFAKHYGLPLSCLTELTELGLLSVVAALRGLVGRDVRNFGVRLRAPILGFSPWSRVGSPVAGRSS